MVGFWWFEVQLHLNNRKAIRRMGGNSSPYLYMESLRLWFQAIQREITILQPEWVASKDNLEADFLSSDRTSNLHVQNFRDLPNTESLAHFRCIYFERESSSPKVHELGRGLKGSGSEYPGLLL